MRLSIRPPEYVPRLGTLALWLASDHAVLGDTFPVSRPSPQTRAGIRSSPGTTQDRLWLSVPLRGVTRGRTPAVEAPVSRDEPWQRAHLRAIDTCYRTSPYFEHYFPQVRALLEGERGTLAEYSIAWCEWVWGQVSDSKNLGRASGLASNPGSLRGVLEAVTPLATDKVLVLAESARHEANLIREHGGEAQVLVLDFDERPRRQSFEGFVPGLCALDLLMHYGPASADYLREGTRLVPLTAWLSMATS
jgi:hypothetical protein